MRKQYHFRPSELGLQAWDVHGLVESSKHLLPTKVRLVDIHEIDQAYWYQACDAPPTCRDIVEHMRLVQAADLAYPIILAADGSVMDGMHRIAKALLLGDTHILAVRFQLTPEPDFIGIAADQLSYE